ncbi:MAG: hypothetical protein ACTFAL_00290 [Candidatus Electronema sp. V4]|uniref:hypothetical protein n=1 Tax=Candidatus Electronema sp. V4 TaxID=3454756 RepID=UPI00405592A9
MSNEITPKESANRNPFAGTGIAVIGIVRHFASQQGKDGKLYHDLFLTTAANPDLKISLLASPDPSRFQIGSPAKIMVRLQSWQKESRSGMMLKEVAS